VRGLECLEDRIGAKTVNAIHCCGTGIFRGQSTTGANQDQYGDVATVESGQLDFTRKLDKVYASATA